MTCAVILKVAPLKTALAAGEGRSFEWGCFPEDTDSAEDQQTRSDQTEARDMSTHSNGELSEVSSREDPHELAAALGLSGVAELEVDRFRVERRKFESMLAGQYIHWSPCFCNILVQHTRFSG